MRSDIALKHIDPMLKPSTDSLAVSRGFGSFTFGDEALVVSCGIYEFQDGETAAEYCGSAASFCCLSAQFGVTFADEGETAAHRCSPFANDGDLAALFGSLLAVLRGSSSHPSPNDACLRRFCNPFRAHWRSEKGLSFVQDGRAGPSVEHLAAFGLKVQGA